MLAARRISRRRSCLTAWPRGWVARRREIAQRYDAAFAGMSAVQPLAVRPDVVHACHLYMVRVKSQEIGLSRTQVFATVRAEGIGINVHYISLHLHPFYRKCFGTGPGLCPVAEKAYEDLITLLVFPAMSDDDVEAVVTSVASVVK